MAPSYTIPSAFGDIETEPFMFLGQIVGWILHRHRSDVDGSAEDWDAAERELFDLLDSGGIDVQGYRAPDFPSVYESLPVGIWKTINRGKAGDPTFSPIDESEGREDGASVVAGNDRWDGVRIPKKLVLKHWPPLGGKRLGTMADEERAKAALAAHLSKQGEALKRADAEAICKPFGISKRRFQSHVWPEARKRAGLPAKAPAGRKS